MNGLEKDLGVVVNQVCVHLPKCCSCDSHAQLGYCKYCVQFKEVWCKCKRKASS